MEIKESTIKRIGGYLHRFVPIADTSGKIHSYTLKPFMNEFKPRDIMQVIIGCVLLAIPISLSEKVWDLSKSLPIINVSIIVIISLLLVSVFVYINFYKVALKGYVVKII